ncbi:MAG: hypothetical protein H6708_03085 [Kofleriaceae bacterium]|nr:hypothetical protein [Myxococcales bacterium]MCB9559377.1 hypothetical protein [Kofleriaceae bacterium]
MPVRHLALALVVAVAACHGTPAAPGATPGAAAPAAGDAPIANVATGGDPAPADDGTRRCLPTVAAECGCVYACAPGRLDGDHWIVDHPFWAPTPLHAHVDRWCVDGACTDAFFGAIVCDGICAPRPADASCHFDDAGACVGSSAP